MSTDRSMNRKGPLGTTLSAGTRAIFVGSTTWTVAICGLLVVTVVVGVGVMVSEKS